MYKNILSYKHIGILHLKSTPTTRGKATASKNVRPQLSCIRKPLGQHIIKRDMEQEQGLA